MTITGLNKPRIARLAVMLSGRGSNFKAIVRAIEAGNLPEANIDLVVSNRSEAEGLQFALREGLPTWVLNTKAYAEPSLAYDGLLEELRFHAIDWVILAGYDRILPSSVTQAYAGRILNMHPSLLPAYGGKGMVGLAVHQAVLANNEAESGCSVHLVTEGVDEGPVVAQVRVPVMPGDSPETLAARVLQQEHQLYPQAIRQVIQQWQAG